MYNLSSHYRSEMVKMPGVYAMGFPNIKFYSAGFMVHLLENLSLSVYLFGIYSY